MARDQTRPITDEDIQTLREDIEEIRKEVREDLAADFGGDPEDYRAGEFILDDE
jgi:predicted 2-oxoglutarate/Fe(II)-dependent dioxygenase YbiX